MVYAKIHYKWPCSLVRLVNHRVTHILGHRMAVCFLFPTWHGITDSNRAYEWLKLNIRSYTHTPLIDVYMFIIVLLFCRTAVTCEKHLNLAKSHRLYVVAKKLWRVNKQSNHIALCKWIMIMCPERTPAGNLAWPLKSTFFC